MDRSLEEVKKECPKTVVVGDKEGGEIIVKEKGWFFVVEPKS